MAPTALSQRYFPAIRKQCLKVLELLSQTDLDIVLPWRNDPSVRRCMYSSHVITADEHQKWFNHISAAEDRIALLFSVGEEPRGVVQFNQLNVDARRGRWGFYIDPKALPHWSLLVEFEALEYAFEVLKLHKLDCEVISFNKKVINLHKKSGFLEEGWFVDYHYDGTQFHDVCRLSMLANNWPEHRARIAARIDRLNFHIDSSA